MGKRSAVSSIFWGSLLTCLGEACNSMKLTPDPVAGRVILEYGISLTDRAGTGFSPHDAARLVIRTAERLRVDVIHSRFSEDVDTGGRHVCSGDRLIADGRDYCDYNMPDFLHIPHRLGNVVEIDWLAPAGCRHAECGWI